MSDDDVQTALTALTTALNDTDVDEAILSYMAEILADMSMESEEIIDALTPLIMETGIECPDMASDVVMKAMDILGRGTCLDEREGDGDNGLKLLNEPVILLKRTQELDKHIQAAMQLQLGFKKVLFVNKMITTWDDPDAKGDMDELSLALARKNEKKMQKTEKKGVAREKVAGMQRNDIMEQLTRAPIVIHNGSAFSDLLSEEKSCGSTDIQLKQISMDLGGISMLEDANLTMVFGRRYGLVGRNGVGKTTFLKHVAAKAWEGIPRHLHVLHISQEVVGSELTVLQTVLQTDIEREELLCEAADLEAGKVDPGVDVTKRMQEVYDRLRDIDADSAPARASAILAGLGFSQEELHKPTNSFSGGWRMRVSLALALFIEPDVLLADEPTNHLDLHAVVWLEEYLKAWTKTLVVVSHDRNFLDSVCTDIVLLQNKTLQRFKGDYTTYENRRAEALLNEQRQHDASERERAHIQKFVDKFRANASRASMVQSRIKALDRMGTVSLTVMDPEVRFKFPSADRSVGTNPLIQMIDVNYAYSSNERMILEKCDFSLNINSRVCLVGPNGVGKSTLMKLLTGELDPLSGMVTRNNTVRVGRFTQHHVDQLDLQKSPLEMFKFDYPDHPPAKIRAHLGSMGITGKLALQPNYSLSGGQKSRVALARITYSEPHLLLLDEPTNHLDLDTVQALIMALSQYDGGLFVISHDEHMITTACEELWILDESKRVHRFEGDFEEYKSMLKKKATSTGN